MTDPFERPRTSRARLVFGVAILAAVGIFWLLLVIGLASGADDPINSLFGMVLITFVPILIGLRLIRGGRAEKEPKITQTSSTPPRRRRTVVGELGEVFEDILGDLQSHESEAPRPARTRRPAGTKPARQEPRRRSDVSPPEEPPSFQPPPALPPDTEPITSDELISQAWKRIYGDD